MNRNHDYLYVVSLPRTCACLHKTVDHDYEKRLVHPCQVKDCGCIDFTRQTVEVKGCNLHDVAGKLKEKLDDIGYVSKTII